MKLDYDYYTMRDTYRDKLAYENDTDTYDILIFTDMTVSMCDIEKSDIICVFDDTTGAALAFIERVRKSDLSMFKRLTLFFHNRKVMRETPIGYECYIKKKGEYIEYQFYKRWWYDLSIQLGSIDLSKHIVKHPSSRREDESGPSDL